MTLVIVRKVQNSIFIVGDTKLTLDSIQQKLSATDGVLKTKIVSPSLAISFAGNEYIAHKAVREISERHSPDTVVRILLDAHRSTALDVTADFIVSVAGEERTIYVIKEGEVTSPDFGWIGSYPAFRRFREYELGNRYVTVPPANTAKISMISVPEEKGSSVFGYEIYMRMLYAMMNTVEDPEIFDVGGLPVPLAAVAGTFRYFGHTQSRTHPFDIKPGVTEIEFGTAAQGGFSYDLIALKGGTGVAAYFLQGEFGILFESIDSGFPKPRIVTGLPPLEFEERFSAEVGSEVRTTFAGPHLLCARAMRRMDEGDFAGAISDAEYAIARGETNPDGWRCRALVNLHQNRLKEALSDAERSVEFAPYDVEALSVRGQVQRACGLFQEACRSYSQAIGVDPARWKLFADRATVWWKLGSFERAIEDLSVALIFQPYHGELWKNMVAVCQVLGRADEYVSALLMAGQLCPNDHAINRALTQQVGLSYRL